MTLLTQASPFRAIRRIRQPDIEPVSLAEVKDVLGIAPEVSDDDVFLSALIAAARQTAEERMNRTLTLTRWQAVAIRWGRCACEGIEMPYPPFFVDADHPVEVVWTDRDDVEHVVDQADIRVNTVEFPGRLKVTATIADSCCEATAVVRWWGGVKSARDVPAPARVGLLRHVAALFNNRGDDAATVLQNDPAIDALYASCSWSGRY